MLDICSRPTASPYTIFTPLPTQPYEEVQSITRNLDLHFKL